MSMETKFDGVITPLKIDISTGDVITPKEIRYRFNLILEDRTIEVWAYNLETVLAEKLETVISRNVTNTRMRDFYDIYIKLAVLLIFEINILSPLKIQEKVIICNMR